MTTFKRGSKVTNNVELKGEYSFSKSCPVGSKGVVTKAKRNGTLYVSFKVGAYSDCFITTAQTLQHINTPQNYPVAGDIFYTSWGYEQTNIDFYQVISASGKSVKVRRIEGKITDYKDMSGHTTPAKDCFRGNEQTFRLNFNIDGSPSFKVASYAHAMPIGRQTSFFFSEYH